MADPYEHEGVGTPSIHDWAPGLSCEACDQYNANVKAFHAEQFNENWAGILFTSVPGGASVARMDGSKGPGVTAIEHRKEFEKGMNDYKDNKEAGLTPDSTVKGGVKKAYERAERNERLSKKYKSGELDARGITLEKPFLDATGIKE